MISAATRREQGPVAVAVLDANPMLGEAMCRHVRASKPFGGDDVVSLTWERVGELAHIRPGIVVLDPGEASDGLEELVAGLRAAVPEIRLVAYASDPSQAQARACMTLGFRAFIPKSAEIGQITSALAAVASGGMYIDRRYAAALMPQAVPGPGAAGPLSAREEGILRRIALGLSHKQIAGELGLSHKTVDTYRARGMRKLGLSDRGELVRFALKQGWLN